MIDQYVMTAVRLGLISSLLLCGSQATKAGPIEDIAPCVVFLMRPESSGTDTPVGSAFLVRTNDSLLLITAAHVAIEVGRSAIIIMPGKDGKAVRATGSQLDWRQSSSADAAVVRLKINDTNSYAKLLARSLPAHLIALRPIPPEREMPLTIMGYTLALGTTDYVSPLSLEAKAASGLISLPRADTGQTATFILLQQPNIQGMSGGPVFDMGSTFTSGRKIVVREGVSLVGLVHGTWSDSTGGKLGAIVPASEIQRLIDELHIGSAPPPNDN